MTNWTTVFFYEVRQQFQRKAFLFMTFGIPALALVALAGYLIIAEIRRGDDDVHQEGSLQSEFAEEEVSGFVDLSGSVDAPEIEATFAQWLKRYDTFAEGEAALTAGDILNLFVIEEDYPETGRVTQWMSEFDISGASGGDLIETFLLFAIAGNEADPAAFARLRTPATAITEQQLGLDSEQVENRKNSTDIMQVYIFGMMMMMCMMITSNYLLASVVAEKENKTVEILLTSVRPLPMLFGKILAMGVVGMTIVAVWSVSLMLLARLASAQIVDLSTLNVKPLTGVIAIIYFVLGYGFIGAIFAAVGAIINNVRDGSQMAGWLVIPIMVPIFFINQIANDPNSTLAVVLSMIPFTAPLAMVMRTAISTVPVLHIIVSIILMVGLVAGAIWLSSRVFRVNILLSGTTPKIREIPKLLLRG